MELLSYDLRLVLRALRRSPGFAAVAVLTLALGIGANTAIFSLVNAVLLKPLPVEALDRLVVIREDLPDLNLLDAKLAPAEVLDLRARAEVFQAVAGFRAADWTLTGWGEPARLPTALTLGDFAGVFGIRPYLGRFYGQEQSIDGPIDVAVISYGLWQQLSGGDPSFLGRAIELDGIAYEVIGVMPPDFRYPREVQAWVPFEFGDRWKENRGSLFMTTVARLRPGITHEQVAARLLAEVSRWNERYHSGGLGKVLSSTSFVEYLAGPLRLILLVLTGAVVFVLLIAAANIGSLQLVRTVGRVKEIAVRAAIGAGRARVVRQFLLESTLLAAAGGAVGLIVGLLALDLLKQWGPVQQFYLPEISLDGAVLVFTGLVALSTTILFGGVPAVWASRVDPQHVLRQSTRGASGSLRRNRLLEANLVVQVALALVLLLGSGLMIRTLARLLARDPGFDPQHLVTGQVSIPSTTYDTPEKRVVFFDALLERLRALPDVAEAALISGLPFTGQSDSSPFDISGRPRRPGEPERHAEARIVSPGYFRTMGIPLLRGRDFDGTERSGVPLVAVIDRTFAEQFFPNEDPIGRRIQGYFADEATIIGVAGQVDHNEIGGPPKAAAYYSYHNQPWQGWRSIVVRSRQPVEAVAKAIRSVVFDLDPNVPVYDVQTMEGRIERSLGPRRLALLALGAFSALSLVLASLGAYGVMRYTTEQQTRELGIRVALGSRPGELVGLVVRRGLAVTAAGLVLGALAGLALTQLMRGMLFEVSPHDPATFAVAVAALVGVTVAAGSLPAYAAARVNPAEMLRQE